MGVAALDEEMDVADASDAMNEELEVGDTNETGEDNADVDMVASREVTSNDEIGLSVVVVLKSEKVVVALVGKPLSVVISDPASVVMSELEKGMSDGKVCSFEAML